MAFSRRFVQSIILMIAVGLSLVLAMGTWKGTSQQDRREEEAPVDNSLSEAEMKLIDMEYTEMRGGRRLWTIKASEAKYFQAEQKTILRSVLLTFFLKDEGEIHLESQQGILYAGTKNIELWDSVRAKLPEGYEFSTERAFYEHELETISSDTGIRVSGPDLQLRSDHWKYKIPEHRAMLEGAVQATLAFLPLKTGQQQ